MTKSASGRGSVEDIKASSVVIENQILYGG